MCNFCSTIIQELHLLPWGNWKNREKAVAPCSCRQNYKKDERDSRTQRDFCSKNPVSSFPLILISFLHVSENLVTMFYGWDFLQRLLMHWFAALWPSPEANIWRRVHWHNAKQGWSAPLIPKETFLEKKKDQGFSVLLLKKKIMWPKLSKECNWYVSQWPTIFKWYQKP